MITGSHGRTQNFIDKFCFFFKPCIFSILPGLTSLSIYPWYFPYRYVYTEVKRIEHTQALKAKVVETKRLEIECLKQVSVEQDLT